MKTMTVRDAAALWGLSERRVAISCKEGRIKWANKQSHAWLIPADAQKPAANRSARKSAGNLPAAMTLSVKFLPMRMRTVL